MVEQISDLHIKSQVNREYFKQTRNVYETFLFGLLETLLAKRYLKFFKTVEKNAIIQNVFKTLYDMLSKCCMDDIKKRCNKTLYSR